MTLVVLGGCSAPAATLQLIGVARETLAAQRDAQTEMHAELMGCIESRRSALDTAFDADVRLAAAGGITDAEGNRVRLTPEWVISARKGYAAARDLAGADAMDAAAAHRTRMDNLRAADEALEMAAALIIRQTDVTERIRQHLLTLQRRFIHE